MGQESILQVRSLRPERRVELPKPPELGHHRRRQESRGQEAGVEKQPFPQDPEPRSHKSVMGTGWSSQLGACSPSPRAGVSPRGARWSPDAQGLAAARTSAKINVKPHFPFSPAPFSALAGSKPLVFQRAPSFPSHVVWVRPCWSTCLSLGIFVQNRE